MARVGYILTRMDGTDITTDNVVLDQVSLRNLDTKVEIGTVPLNPVRTSLFNYSATRLVAAYLSSDGKLFAFGTTNPLDVYEINITTGVNTIAVNTVAGAYGMGLYVDDIYIYIWAGWWDTGYDLRKYNRSTGAYVSTVHIVGASTLLLQGLGYDGLYAWVVNFPISTNGQRKIQKRNWTTLALVAEYDYPTGYSTANFYSCQIDSQNPTHLWLQGELGANGVIVVWNTLTQSIISEWSSTDRLRWMNQQLAPGGVEIENNSITFLTLPLIQGTTLLPVLCKNSGVNWVKVVLEFAIIDPITGLPGVYSDCTVGVGGDPFPWLLPPEETLKHVSWAAASDLAPGSYTVSLHLKLIKE